MLQRFILYLVSSVCLCPGLLKEIWFSWAGTGPSATMGHVLGSSGRSRWRKTGHAAPRVLRLRICFVGHAAPRVGRGGSIMLMRCFLFLSLSLSLSLSLLPSSCICICCLACIIIDCIYTLVTIDPLPAATKATKHLTSPMHGANTYYTSWPQ